MSVRKVILGSAVVAALVAAYAVIPRHADLRAFDPAGGVLRCAGEAIPDADWAAIEARLVGAYRSLKASVAR